jgi:septal ring factor EnvC (AmiA/AmiB activator)
LNKRCSFALRLFALWACFFIASPLAISASQDADLKKLNSEIQQKQQELKKKQQEHTQITSSLKKTETELSLIVREKNTLQQAISQQLEELSNLVSEEKSLLILKAEQEEKIALQVNASYRLGHAKNAKVILNQTDSRAISRSLVYSDYLTRARLELLKNYEATLEKINTNKLAIEEKNKELLSNQSIIAEKEEIIKVSYQKRNEALKDLQNSISTDTSKINELKNNHAKLQELLNKIKAQQLAAQKATEKAKRDRELAQQKVKKSSDVKSTTIIKPLSLPDNHQPFAQTKGRLPWPVKGHLDNRYGKTRKPGDFRWEGIAFIAPMGAEVKSIHSGQVVFADWFRGKGFLLIIDHGNGYMTLYAHNQTLLKKAGEQVSSGDVIATVGNSGGLTSPELYFELRHQGKPINPNYWLHNRG